jgi:hypothetical protein
MSHWDFGRLPADQHDAAIPAEGDFPYGPGEVTYHSDPPDLADLAGGGDSAGSFGGQDLGGQDLGEQDFGDQDFGDQDFGLYPITYERGRIEPDADPSGPATAPYEAYDPYEPYEIWPPAPAPDDSDAPGQRQGDLWQGGAWQGDPWQGGAWQSQGDRQPWPPRPLQPDPPRPGRRWLIPAGVALAVAAIGGATVLLAGGHPGGAAGAGSATRPASPATSATAAQPAPAPSAAGATAPALTLAQAQGVLAEYTSANNSANAQRSDARLATIETGGSYAIDASQYRLARAAGAATFPAFTPVSATYYLPRTEPSAGPRWFAVQVANAFASSPQKVSSVEYLVFTQATPGGPWVNAIEPYLLSPASAPRVAVSGGLATPVAVTAGSLSTAPGQLPGHTAAALNGHGSVTVPAILADGTDRQFWRHKLPAATVTDTHAPATGTAGETFALRTADGGALVFYTDAARLTITAPAGSMLRVTVPGLYSPAQPLPSAGLGYLDQFAAYDPPAGGGTPRIIADYSGITGKA